MVLERNIEIRVEEQVGAELCDMEERSVGLWGRSLGLPLREQDLEESPMRAPVRVKTVT